MVAADSRGMRKPEHSRDDAAKEAIDFGKQLDKAREDEVQDIVVLLARSTVRYEARNRARPMDGGTIEETKNVFSQQQQEDDKIEHAVNGFCKRKRASLVSRHFCIICQSPSATCCFRSVFHSRVSFECKAC